MKKGVFLVLNNECAKFGVYIYIFIIYYDKSLCFHWFEYYHLLQLEIFNFVEKHLSLRSLRKKSIFKAKSSTDYCSRFIRSSFNMT